MTLTQLYNLSHEEFLDRACVVGRAASWWRRQWRRSRRTNIEWWRRWRELAASWKLHELRRYSNHRHTITYHSTLALCSSNYICAIHRRRNSPLWWYIQRVVSENISHEEWSSSVRKAEPCDYYVPHTRWVVCRHIVRWSVALYSNTSTGGHGVIWWNMKLLNHADFSSVTREFNRRHLSPVTASQNCYWRDLSSLLEYILAPTRIILLFIPRVSK